MKKLIMILTLILFPMFCYAAPVYLTCDPQTNVDTYNIFLGGVKVAESPAIVDIETGLYYLMFDLVPLGLADGDYIATATAENEWGESDLSNEAPFTKVVPNPPPNLRASSE